MDEIGMWMKQGCYLPQPLRDFHDQKDLFKAMHEAYEQRPQGSIKMPDWVSGQCYVIDWFLWFMARRGYTLQKCRTKLPFRDLVADVEAAREKRDAAMVAAFSNRTPPVGTTGGDGGSTATELKERARIANDAVAEIERNQRKQATE